MTLIGVLALLSGCDPARAPVGAASRIVPASPVEDVVPVARVLNEIRCDYLDFAASDYARARRLAVGKVTGSVTLSVARGGDAATGVLMAPAALRIDRAGPRPAADAPFDDGLTLAFAMDPDLALNPAASGLDCTPDKRLAQPILSFTALAAGLSEVSGGTAIRIRSPLRYRGQFYLRREDGGVAAVVVRVDRARAGADARYVQSFDVTVETGAPSWFADVGPATAEPRPDHMPPAKAPPPARSSRVLSVPQAPRPGQPRARAPIATAAVEHRCIGTSGDDIVCY